jgi:hypothetical protein
VLDCRHNSPPCRMRHVCTLCTLQGAPPLLPVRCSYIHAPLPVRYAIHIPRASSLPVRFAIYTPRVFLQGGVCVSIGIHAPLPVKLRHVYAAATSQGGPYVHSPPLVPAVYICVHMAICTQPSCGARCHMCTYRAICTQRACVHIGPYVHSGHVYI